MYVFVFFTALGSSSTRMDWEQSKFTVRLGCMCWSNYNIHRYGPQHYTPNDLKTISDKITWNDEDELDNIWSCLKPLQPLLKHQLGQLYGKRKKSKSSKPRFDHSIIYPVQVKPATRPPTPTTSSGAKGTKDCCRGKENQRKKSTAKKEVRRKKKETASEPRQDSTQYPKTSKNFPAFIFSYFCSLFMLRMHGSLMTMLN